MVPSKNIIDGLQCRRRGGALIEKRMGVEKVQEGQVGRGNSADAAADAHAFWAQMIGLFLVSNVAVWTLSSDGRTC